MSTRNKLEGLVAEIEQAKARRKELEAQGARLQQELRELDERIGIYDTGLRGAVADARREYLRELTDGLNERALAACNRD